MAEPAWDLLVVGGINGAGIALLIGRGLSVLMVEAEDLAAPRPPRPSHGGLLFEYGEFRSCAKP
jgi:glycerol-3-phosphate dehydrogenase